MKSEQEKQRGSTGREPRAEKRGRDVSLFLFLRSPFRAWQYNTPSIKNGVVRKSISSMTPLLRRIKATLKCRRIALDAIFDLITYQDGGDSIDRSAANHTRVRKLLEVEQSDEKTLNSFKQYLRQFMIILQLSQRLINQKYLLSWTEEMWHSAPQFPWNNDTSRFSFKATVR